jgi:hypothetical protein
MDMSDLNIPRALRIWFIIHFIIDVVLAIPLLLIPRTFLSVLGWQTIDPLAARIVAAALFGIGIESFLCRNSGVESFRNMLNLKIIWSAGAVIGTVITIVQNSSASTIAEWMILITFFVFNIVWIYWRRYLK